MQIKMQMLIILGIAVAYNQTKHSMLCVVLYLVQNAVIMWLHMLCKNRYAIA
nr:MAG TPA: hypothetical protein [Caudoviricetes sp.]